MVTPPPVEPLDYRGADPAERPPPIGLAVAAMACGTLSIVSLCLPFWSVPLAVAAVALGTQSLVRSRRGTAGGGRMAAAGVACGTITLSLWLRLVWPLVTLNYRG